MDNYLMLDGKKYELSPELVNALRSIDPVPEKKKAFARNGGEDCYWYIGSKGSVCEDDDRNYGLDDARYAVANYCTDKSLMEQRAMHETLNRLLWRYCEEHGGDNAKWKGDPHYYICFSKMNRNDFEVYANDNFCIQGVVYFKDKETAKAAIEEIVKPFLAARPDFVW